MMLGASRLGWLGSAVLLVGRASWAYDFDPDDREAAKRIARQMGEDMLTFYHGDEPGHVPGLLELPYYWWYGGAMFGSLIDYWYYTGDDRWNELTMDGLMFQVGSEEDYMPINQTRTEGNDDQGFWGLAVMTAAEYNFPNPPEDRPQWLALAQAVFNTQAARWDMEHCRGGLRWQIFPWNAGYDYKNTISQGCFFALAARLALFTGNSSYADWADKTWDWMVGVKFIDSSYQVYDGAGIGDNCTDIVPYQWTYNVGTFILGAAAMYNYTGEEVWKHRLDGLLGGARVFFIGDDGDIMSEVACEPVDLCNYDQESFKAYLSRWMAVTTKWAPHTFDSIMPLLRSSAVAAARHCTGGENGRMCGIKWAYGEYDGTTGLGQQMAAMEIVLATMIENSSVPVTSSSGGTSQGDPAAGGAHIGDDPTEWTRGNVTAADQAGGAILTMLIVGGLVSGIFFIIVDESSSKPVVDQMRDFKTSVAAEIAGAGAGAAAAIRRRRNGEQEGEKDDDGHVSTTSSPRSSEAADGAPKLEEPAPVLPFHLGHLRKGSAPMLGARGSGGGGGSSGARHRATVSDVGVERSRQIQARRQSKRLSGGAGAGSSEAGTGTGRPVSGFLVHEVRHVR